MKSIKAIIEFMLYHLGLSVQFTGRFPVRNMLWTLKQGFAEGCTKKSDALLNTAEHALKLFGVLLYQTEGGLKFCHVLQHQTEGRMKSWHALLHQTTGGTKSWHPIQYPRGDAMKKYISKNYSSN